MSSEEARVPSGKHKGRLLSSFSKSEHHFLWASWNGSLRLKESPFFKLILAKFDRFKVAEQPSIDFDRKTAVDSEKQQLLDTMRNLDDRNTTVQRITFGKHKGTPISDIPSDYLVWCSENLSVPALRLIVVAELERRGTAASPKTNLPKPSIRKQNTFDSTHYDWTDSSGFVHSIPNDVSMTGRENEECPFAVCS